MSNIEKIADASALSNEEFEKKYGETKEEFIKNWEEAGEVKEE